MWNAEMPWPKPIQPPRMKERTLAFPLKKRCVISPYPILDFLPQNRGDSGHFFNFPLGDPAAVAACNAAL